MQQLMSASARSRILCCASVALMGLASVLGSPLHLPLPCSGRNSDRSQAFSGVAQAFRHRHQGRRKPTKLAVRSQTASAEVLEEEKDTVLTMADVERAAAKLGVTLSEKTVGPWYEIELLKGDKPVGSTTGWATPWGAMHLETIEVRKFTGYWVKPSQGSESRRYADVAKVARWFGLLLAAATACWNRERSPFYCPKAQLLAIYDEEKQHNKLVRYYKGLGFKVVQEPDEISIVDQASWGGIGTMMDIEEKEFMRLWTPIIRQLAYGVLAPQKPSTGDADAEANEQQEPVAEPAVYGDPL